MKNLLVSTCLIIYFIVSVHFGITALTTSISYISQQAIAQPMREVFLSPSSSNNSTITNSSFLTYENDGALKMVMEYLFKWKTMLVDDKAIIFLPPSKKDKFSENLVVALFDINSTISAGQLSGEAINNYAEHYDDFFIIYSKPFIFKSDPAYMLSYKYTRPPTGTISALDIGIKHHNKAYVISYSAEEPEYCFLIALISM